MPYAIRCFATRVVDRDSPQRRRYGHRRIDEDRSRNCPSNVRPSLAVGRGWPREIATIAPGSAMRRLPPAIAESYRAVVASRRSTERCRHHPSTANGAVWGSPAGSHIPMLDGRLHPAGSIL